MGASFGKMLRSRFENRVRKTVALALGLSVRRPSGDLPDGGDDQGFAFHFDRREADVHWKFGAVPPPCGEWLSDPHRPEPRTGGGTAPLGHVPQPVELGQEQLDLPAE